MYDDGCLISSSSGNAKFQGKCLEFGSGSAYYALSLPLLHAGEFWHSFNMDWMGRWLNPTNKCESHFWCSTEGERQTVVLWSFLFQQYNFAGNDQISSRVPWKDWSWLGGDWSSFWTRRAMTLTLVSELPRLGLLFLSHCIFLWFAWEARMRMVLR